LKTQYRIRKAKVTDVKSIHKLIKVYADKHEMLPRALNAIYENIQGIFVCENKKGIAGCCAVSVSWDDLAEIKSLAVSEGCKHKGLGSKLVDVCEKEAKKLGVKRIFVLTYVPGFFGKLGYKPVSKDELPHKVWTECISCPFFPDCNEVPLMKHV
jgi:amino-acid N-acetyltransferase